MQSNEQYTDRLDHSRDGDFSPATIRTTLKRQHKGRHTCCGYCGGHIGNLADGEHHHIFGIGQAKQAGILAQVSSEIAKPDNDVFVHRQDCHPHLNHMQERGILYPEVMRREGRLQILKLFGPRVYFNGEDWIEIRSVREQTHRGLRQMRVAFRQ